ncbi:MAG: hypothetical protein ACM3NH_01050 [Candidatus Saccharibacteria bacterium]
MKQATCPQMGGPETCRAVITGNTPEEMVDNGMNHVKQAHPEMAADIKKLSKDEADKWMTDFRKTFDALPSV